MSKKHAKVKAGGKVKIKELKFSIKGLKGNFDLSALMEQFGRFDNRNANRNNHTDNRNANRNNHTDNRNR